MSLEGNDQELVEGVRVKMKENKRILRYKTPKDAGWGENQEDGWRFLPEERQLPISEARGGIGRMGVDVPKFGMGERGRQSWVDLNLRGFPPNDCRFFRSIRIVCISKQKNLLGRIFFLNWRLKIH